MSTFIKHIPCHKCGSRDNLAEYSDHFWCFGCGYYEEKIDIASLREKINGTDYRPKPWGDIRNNISFTKHIPKKAMKWLLQYRIIPKEIEKYNILWCQENETLILVHTDEYWQGRHFGKYGLKYLSKGKKPLTIYGESDTIILVEDVLSAIKIARLSPEYCAMPLLGSSLSTEHEEVLRDIFKTIYVWLDRDKAKQGIKMSRNLRQKGMNTKSIITDLDPKEYTEGEIKTWLKNKL